MGFEIHHPSSKPKLKTSFKGEEIRKVGFNRNVSSSSLTKQNDARVRIIKKDLQFSEMKEIEENEVAFSSTSCAFVAEFRGLLAVSGLYEPSLPVFYSVGSYRNEWRNAERYNSMLVPITRTCNRYFIISVRIELHHTAVLQHPRISQ